MGETIRRALQKDLRFLLLPAAIALVVALAFSMQAVQANHPGGVAT